MEIIHMSKKSITYYKHQLTTFLVGLIPYYFVKYKWCRRLIWFYSFSEYAPYNSFSLDWYLQTHYPILEDDFCLFEYYEEKELK